MKLHVFNYEGNVRTTLHLSEELMERHVLSLNEIVRWEEISKLPTMNEEYLLRKVEDDMRQLLGNLKDILKAAK